MAIFYSEIIKRYLLHLGSELGGKVEKDFRSCLEIFTRSADLNCLGKVFVFFQFLQLGAVFFPSPNTT